MSVIFTTVDVRSIRDALQNETNNLVKNIWYTRRIACVEAVGEVLNEYGYLPSGTTWYASGNDCVFEVDKGGKYDLAHYFHEGMIYGPNIPIFEKYEYDANGKKHGVGEIIKYRSPKGKKKKPTGRYLKQGPYKSTGVRHWTEAIEKDGALYDAYMRRCEELLLRK